MRVPMRQRRMPVPVGVRLAGLPPRFVLIAIVFVVAMPVLMLYRFMDMLVRKRRLQATLLRAGCAG